MAVMETVEIRRGSAVGRGAASFERSSGSAQRDVQHRFDDGARLHRPRVQSLHRFPPGACQLRAVRVYGADRGLLRHVGPGAGAGGDEVRVGVLWPRRHGAPESPDRDRESPLHGHWLGRRGGGPAADAVAGDAVDERGTRLAGRCLFLLVPGLFRILCQHGAVGVQRVADGLAADGYRQRSQYLRGVGDLARDRRSAICGLSPARGDGLASGLERDRRVDIRRHLAAAPAGRFLSSPL